LIHDEDDGREKTGQPQPAMPVIEGVMLFADSYPAPLAAGEFSLAGERKSKWSGKELYGGFMFHGPRLQGVSTMESWGENGATATLKAMPAADFFASGRHPAFATDPIMLDAAGQVIAYWTADHLEQAFHIFPFRLESLLLYGSNLPAGEQAVCRAKIELKENLQVRSDIDIIGPDGKVRMRLLGWWDRRFDKPDRFYQLRVQPKTSMLSDLWQGGEAAGIDKGMTFCLLSGLTKDFLSAHNRIWMRVLAHLVLSRRERQHWYGMAATEARRMEWLLGRTAIKDCIRYHLRENGREDVYPADIEIAVDDNGRPYIDAIAGDKNSTCYSISISHSADVTFAAVGSGDKKGVGIDVEQYRALTDDFDKLAFTETELGILAGGSDAERQEWALRLWCAKEAAVKKTGIGLGGNPKDFCVSAVNRGTGEVEVVIAGQNPHDNVQVKTLRQGDYIVAIAS
jgi:phosphopantetheinyl transferase